MSSEPRLLKKYPNRRLYDTRISSYVTLDDVRQLVLEGEEFEVRDARSDHDITRQVLLQIIAEREENGSPLLGKAALRALIRFHGDPLQTALGRYLEHSLQTFVDQQASLRKQFGSSSSSPFALLNQIAERNLELWKSVLKGGSLGSGQPGRKATGGRTRKS